MQPHNSIIDTDEQAILNALNGVATGKPHSAPRNHHLDRIAAILRTEPHYDAVVLFGEAATLRIRVRFSLDPQTGRVRAGPLNKYGFYVRQPDESAAEVFSKLPQEAVPLGRETARPCPRCRGGEVPQPVGTVCSYCKGAGTVPIGRRGNPWGKGKRPVVEGVPGSIAQYYATLFYGNETAPPKDKLDDDDIRQRIAEAFPGQKFAGYNVIAYRARYNSGFLPTGGKPAVRSRRYWVDRHGRVWTKLTKDQRDAVYVSTGTRTKGRVCIYNPTTP